MGSIRLSILALVALAAPVLGIELTCGACWDHCLEKHSKHWKRKDSPPFKFYNLTAECKTAECGACCNGELVKVPGPNGRYFVAWYWVSPSDPGLKARPLPADWGTGGSLPIDIRAGDIRKDGQLVERVAPERTASRGYFRDTPRDCEDEPYLHPCEMAVCRQYQEGLRECEKLDNRIECDWRNLDRAKEGNRICKEAGMTYFTPVPEGEYGPGRIEVPETPIHQSKGRPGK